jgi:phenylpropionate dioxygenase-like ring-hydroxylating dioxygenase large terminal subunit
LQSAINLYSGAHKSRGTFIGASEEVNQEAGMEPIGNGLAHSLVQDGRVHRSVYLDPDIFELEMQRIFAQSWVYVGHDSLVPHAGDYMATRMGRQPVVLSRHTDGKVYVLYNSCGHRGATVCNEDFGHAELFTCPYHGWTFRGDGTVDAISMPRGYGASFDLQNPALGMGQVPRMDSYRGFVFASMSREGPSLREYLGSATSSIDEVVDKAPDGEIDLRGGVHKYVYRGNWKLQLENVVDMYHVPFSHQSTIGRGGRQFKRGQGQEAGSAIATSGNAAVRWEQRTAWGAQANGHSYTGHQPVAEELSNDPVFQAYLGLLEARHGRERALQIIRPTRHNIAFFPNVMLQALNQHVRVIFPISVDRTEVHVYPVQLKGAPEQMNRSSVRNLNLTHSVSSLIQTDDLECFRRCQEGLAAQHSEWVWFARGIDNDRDDGHDGLVNNGTVELPQRSQYAAWLRAMGEAA